LFKLASEAQIASRLSDARRLYTAGLKLAPTDRIALLALADTYRDAGDLDAARKAYEAVRAAGGGYADLALQRLASLVAKPPPLSAQQDDPGGYAAIPEHRNGWRQGLNDGTSGPASKEAERAKTDDTSTTHAVQITSLDGVYFGYSNLISGSPGCRSGRTIRVHIANNKLHLEEGESDESKIFYISSNGSFTGSRSAGGSEVQGWIGKVANNRIEADATDPSCKYRISLERVPGS
jgi:hypothetical protein